MLGLLSWSTDLRSSSSFWNFKLIGFKVLVWFNAGLCYSMVMVLMPGDLGELNVFCLARMVFVTLSGYICVVFSLSDSRGYLATADGYPEYCKLLVPLLCRGFKSWGGLRFLRPFFFSPFCIIA